MTDDKLKQENNNLSSEEQNEAEENASLKSTVIYEIVRRQGIEELKRPGASLFWSGLAAGLALSLSVYFKAFIYASTEGSNYQAMIASFGYALGFVIVILGRLQLFTENTLTVVLPVLAECTRHRILCTARLWSIVFLANMFGSFFSAWFVAKGGLMPHEQIQAAIHISEHLLDYSSSESLLFGIPSGFIIASIAWILPSAKGSEFLVILFLASMISIGGLTHVVAGSTEWFLLSFDGQASWLQSIFSGIAPALLGNIIGGTGLFALIAYAQVRNEI